MTMVEEKLGQAQRLCETLSGSANGLIPVTRWGCYMRKIGDICVWIRLRPSNKALVEITTKGAPGAVGVVYDLETMLPDDKLTAIHTRGERGQRLRDWASEIDRKSVV